MKYKFSCHTRTEHFDSCIYPCKDEKMADRDKTNASAYYNTT